MSAPQIRAEPNNSADSIFGSELRLDSIGLIIVVTLIAFEAMAVATALPTAARDLHGLAGFGWAFTGFLLANIVAMIVSGMLCDVRGPQLPMTLGLLTFLAGLVLAGTAGEMWQLILGRVVQGFGSGLLLTAIYVVIGERYPATLRPKIFAAISSAWVLPSLIGPPLSGFLTQHVSWRAVFLGLAPLVLIGGVLMAPALRAMRRDDLSEPVAFQGRRLVRAVAVAGGLALLVQAGQHPHPLWLLLAPAGAVGLGWGLSALLPPGTVTARRGVPAPVALRGLLSGAMFGTEALIPLSLSVQHGYTATEAGLPLLGSAVGWAVGSWWQGREAVAANRTQLIRAGFVFLAVGCLGATAAAPTFGPAWLVYPAWALAGIGAGLAMSSIGVLLLEFTNDADRGRDSAALQLSDGVVSAITTGVGGVLVAAAANAYIGYTTAFVITDLAMVSVAVVGVVAAGRARPAR